MVCFSLMFQIQELERRMLEESTHRQSLQHDLEQSQDEARQLRSELEVSLGCGQM